MFDIEYKGGNAVVISTKKAKLAIDPNLSTVGLKAVSVKDAVVIATEPSLAVDGADARLVINGPGEYEVADFSIRGVAVDRLNEEKDAKSATMYRIEVGEVRIAVLGNATATLSEAQLEALGVIDVVIVPVGGGDTLGATQATQLVRAIDAKLVVPVHYADNTDELEVFVKEFGGEVEETAKLKVKAASSLPLVATIFAISRS